MQVVIDASEIDALGRAIARLPGEIKTKAFARAMRRMRDMARTRIVRENAKRTDLPVGKVRALTTAAFNAGGNSVEVVMRSDWIGLAKLPHQQTSEGVRVKGRGLLKSAFVAKMKSGHVGVMIRSGSGRLPIRELFGPNPAHDITNNPDEYTKVLAELIEEHLAPRVLHELGRLLPG
ncbi:hypothetical protein [Shinella zoogloeoides]|uniref:hypothetical protein n=1 Tax=Shinella zoogloeoides TaxID=352475 RepID=UPI0028A9C919|nr:hypothetical protein [Shinella zoogloeoides]